MNHRCTFPVPLSFPQNFFHQLYSQAFSFFPPFLLSLLSCFKPSVLSSFFFLQLIFLSHTLGALLCNVRLLLSRTFFPPRGYISLCPSGGSPERAFRSHKLLFHSEPLCNGDAPLAARHPRCSRTTACSGRSAVIFDHVE